MTLVSNHYVHLLVLRELDGGGYGWLAPVELDDDDSSGAALVIPVKTDGQPFQEGYWLEVAVLENGSWRRLSEMFPLKHINAEEFALETNSADIPFVETKVEASRRLLPYAGSLDHPDFTHSLLQIEPVKGDVFDLLLNESKVFLVGCYPFEHYRNQDGSRLK